MEEVKRINIVIVRNSLQVQGRRKVVIKRNPYAIDINRERKYFNCRGFRHMACYCRNCENIKEERRFKFGNNININNESWYTKLLDSKVTVSNLKIVNLFYFDFSLFFLFLFLF